MPGVSFFREGREIPRRVSGCADVYALDAGEDLLARAFLHETDHLNGKLYISYVSPLKRDLIRRKIRKLQKAGEWD